MQKNSGAKTLLFFTPFCAPPRCCGEINAKYSSG
jgi:hypothetical protein